MGYYVILGNEILTAENEQALMRFYTNVKQLPEDYEQNKYIVEDGNLVLNPNYEQEQVQKRQEIFKKDFFNIEGYGWYRRTPKGYTSALESINTAFNSVTILGSLPANTLIFYQKPDFTKEEQCTEEWLVAHQFKNQAMTTTEFGQFYAKFVETWNKQEHLK